LHFYASDSGAD